MGTVFATVVTGVTILVLGRLLQTFMLDPLTELRKVIGEIDYNLTYLAHWYANPFTHDEAKQLPERTLDAIQKASDTLRQCGSRLGAASNATLGYQLWEYTILVPPRAAVREARGHLILLSNAMFRTGAGFPEKGERNTEVRDRIQALLWLEARPHFWSHFRHMVDARWRTKADATSAGR